MRCVICKSNHIENMEVKEEVHVNDDIVYVLINIPVCKECGERYYDRSTLRKLEHLEEVFKKDQSTLQEVGKVLLYQPS